MQDTVRIDVEGYFYLRHTARSRRNTIQYKPADRFIILCHRALTLENVDFYRRLVIRSRRECFALAGRYGCVARNKWGHYAAQCFDTKRKRGYVEQEYILHFTGEYTA